MSELTTLGSWLRRERERRGVTLAKISEETKVAVPLLQGLEADDLSRWPGGIFRRSFARSYAAAIGLDPELVVRRVEEEHPSEPPAPTTGTGDARGVKSATAPAAEPGQARRASEERDRSPREAERRAPPVSTPPVPLATRIQAVALDLLVAGSVGLGFAAAGSRLLWPVIAIAAYHALGLLLTGTTPMMALLLQSRPGAEVVEPVAAPEPAEAAAARRVETEPRHVRRARARRSKEQQQRPRIKESQA